VRPVGVSKGIFVSRILNHFRESPQRRDSNGVRLGEPDFVLCIGDDSSDEFMYKAANQYLAEWRNRQPSPSSSPLVEKAPSVFTCTVGKKPTAAAGYLNSIGDVHALLSSLLRSNNTRHFSTPNLSSMPTAVGAGYDGLGLGLGGGLGLGRGRGGNLTSLGRLSEEGSEGGAAAETPEGSTASAASPEPRAGSDDGRGSSSGSLRAAASEAPAALASVSLRRGGGLAKSPALPRSFSMSHLAHAQPTASTGFISMQNHFQSIHEEDPNDDEEDDEGNFF